MLQECHTHQLCTAVLPTFERVDDGQFSSAVRLAQVEFYLLPLRRRADMPAYVQHHEIEMAAIICPGCIGLLPMYVRDVEPHWSMAKIDFIYECSDCGAEVRQTVTKPERRH
jgi:hypothetical protein